MLGLDEDSGESEVVSERLPSHITNLDFLSECVVFTSKDENLTKSHIKYLEHRLHGIANTAGRYRLVNSLKPQDSALPRADRDAMDEFAANIRTLLGVLGHRVLDPILSSRKSARDAAEATVPSSSAAANDDTASDVTQFRLKSGSIAATAVRTTETFVVLKDSKAAEDAEAKAIEGYVAAHE